MSRVGICAYCGIYSSALTRDHIIPRSLGGRQIVRACSECNQSKRNLFVKQWFERLHALADGSFRHIMIQTRNKTRRSWRKVCRGSQCPTKKARVSHRHKPTKEQLDREMDMYWSRSTSLSRRPAAPPIKLDRSSLFGPKSVLLVE
jgi:HNH endonuclease/C-terminal duplication domain of Friend of PRMT1